MKKLIPYLIAFALIAISPLLEAQKTYKAVCDKSDGRVKIIESEDRSPDMVPLKGGFPFYQVAEKWVKENYPDGRCDPAAAVQQNQAAANAASQPAAVQQQVPAGQQNMPPDPNAFFNAPAVQTPAAIPPFRYRNSSLFISFLFSNLGKVYGLDPPLVPGVGIGIDQVIGTKFYGGTGIHLNALIGKTHDDASVSSFYSMRIPLFAGYRQVTGSRYWGIDLGVAANTMLRPITEDSHLAGETAADYSVNAMTRIRMGRERTTFEIGIDVWLNDILASEEGFQMTVLSVAYRYAF